MEVARQELSHTVVLIEKIAFHDEMIRRGARIIKSCASDPAGRMRTRHSSTITTSRARARPNHGKEQTGIATSVSRRTSGATTVHRYCRSQAARLSHMV